MELISLSTARNVLMEESRDRARMALYAKHLTHLHIVVLTRRSHGFRTPIHVGNLHIYPTNSRTTLGMLVGAYRIARALFSEREGVSCTITSQDPLETGLIAYLLSRATHRPYVVQVHGDYFSPYWTEGSIVRRLRRLLVPFVVRHAERVRVVSKRVLESLTARGLQLRECVVLPIRPELEVFEEAGRHTAKHTEFTVLTASRLVPEKNIPLLIRAFARFHERYPDTLLRIAGEGSERTRIEKVIARSGVEESVTLLPWVPHIENEMASAHVFALASLHESYGLVLLEALASGTPVITTDVGAVGELIEHNVHGIVVPVDDEDALVRALTRMYEESDFRSRASDAGRALVRTITRVSEDEYAEQWVKTHIVT